MEPEKYTGKAGLERGGRPSPLMNAISSSQGDAYDAEITGYH